MVPRLFVLRDFVPTLLWYICSRHTPVSSAFFFGGIRCFHHVDKVPFWDEAEFGVGHSFMGTSARTPVEGNAPQYFSLLFSAALAVCSDEAFAFALRLQQTFAACPFFLLFLASMSGVSTAWPHEA